MEGLAASRHKPARRKRSFLFKLLLTLIGAGILIVIWLGTVMVRIHSTSSSPESAPTDAGIILGAALWGDVPSPGLRERLELGRTLYEEGQIKRIIVTGGLDTPQSRLTEAEGMRNYLVEQGVPEEHILLENQATDTLENLVFSQRVMEEENLESATIITHDYHGMRALDIAEFAAYQEPKLAVTETRVMNMTYHTTREALAYTKWTLNKLQYWLGFKSMNNL